MHMKAVKLRTILALCAIFKLGAQFGTGQCVVAMTSPFQHLSSIMYGNLSGGGGIMLLKRLLAANIWLFVYI